MSAPCPYKFRLYIAGDGSNSAQALANISALCQKHLQNRHEIEVVDVYQDPKRALSDAVFLTPTLLKVTPLPGSRIVGTLSQTEPVMRALGLPVTSV